MSINAQQLEILAKQKEAAINKIIPILMSIGKTNNVNLSDADQANHIFDVLQHMVAGCIAEVASSYDQVAAISDQAAKDAKKLALTIYGERVANKPPIDDKGIGQTASAQRPKGMPLRG